MSYRLRLRVAVPKYEPAPKQALARAAAAPRTPAKASATSISTPRDAIATLLYERDRLDPGAALAGPAIIEQFDATTVIPPGWHASGRCVPQSHSATRDGTMTMDADHRRDPAQQDREPGRGDALSFLSVGLFHHHPRVARLFSCVILDRDGRLIVAPPMFFHAPVYRHLVGRILALYAAPPSAIRDGDVFVSNHPYEGGLPHVSDMAFVAPVFAGGEIVAFAGSIAHKADIGGTVAGSTSANATEMYQEGAADPADPNPRRAAGRCRTSSA